MASSKRQFHDMRERAHEAELRRDRDMPEWYYDRTRKPNAKPAPENLNLIYQEDAE